MKRFLIIVLLAAPLVLFGGRFFATQSANATVTHFWSGWKMSQMAPIYEAVADDIRVDDRTGYLFRIPSGAKPEVVRMFADTRFWWGTEEPQATFAVTSTEIRGKSAVVKSQLKTTLFGGVRTLTLQFDLIKNENWDIRGITFVDMI